MFKPIKKFKGKIKKLCRDMAINHARNSVIYKGKTGEDKLSKILNTTNKKRRKSTRNIVIIGSGASYDAFNQIFPRGEKSVDLIEKKLNFNCIKSPSNSPLGSFADQLNRKYEAIYDRLHLNPNLKDTSFETRLSLMSYFFDSDDIRNEIAKLFDYKTFPSYFYEIIAHLLKNRFIDGVINFNFDELMDQAIDEEVGDGQVKRIISDGDFIPYVEMLTMDKMREPFYIKPHGTASHKSSLRFTKEQYLDIPNEIEDLLEEIFVGQTIYKDGSGNYVDENSQFEKLNLIIFGFAMESIEFNEVLRKAYNRLKKKKRKKLSIYFFSYNDSLVEAQLKLLRKLHSECKTEQDFKTLIKGINMSSKSDSNKEKPELTKLIKEKLRDDIVVDYKEKFKKYGPKKLDKLVEKKFRRLMEGIKKGSQYGEHKRLKDIFDQDDSIKKKYKIKVIGLNKESQDGPVLDSCITKMENKINSFFADNYKPPQTIRHKLLCTMFPSTKLKDKADDLHKKYEAETSEEYQILKNELYFNSKEYYLERVLFEIILVVIKNRGYIQPKESLKGINRVGHYYHLYYNSFRNTQKAKSIHAILENLSLSYTKKSIAKDIYTFSNDQIVKSNIYKKDWFDISAWINSVKCGNPDRRCKKTVRLALSLLKRLKSEIQKDKRLQEFFKRDSLSLYPNYKDFQLNSFGHIDPINIIPTTTALKFRFLNHFLFEEWNVLLMISDRGFDLINALEAIKDPNWRYTNRTIYLVLADIHTRLKSNLKKKLKPYRKKGLKFKILTVPFYDHNSHMKLFFKKKSKCEPKYNAFKKITHLPTNAIYYYKKGFSNNINAVHLRSQYNPRNILILLDKFISYYGKAKKYPPRKKSIMHYDNTDKMLAVLPKISDLKTIRTSLKKLISLEY